MKLTLFEVGIQWELPQLFYNLLYGYNVDISVIISIDEDDVQIHDDKDIKLLGKDLIDVSLEVCYIC